MSDADRDALREQIAWLLQRNPNADAIDLADAIVQVQIDAYAAQVRADALDKAADALDAEAETVGQFASDMPNVVRTCTYLLRMRARAAGVLESEGSGPGSTSSSQTEDGAR